MMFPFVTRRTHAAAMRREAERYNRQASELAQSQADVRDLTRRLFNLQEAVEATATRRAEEAEARVVAMPLRLVVDNGGRAVS